jgi:hypothetical protein
MESEMPFIPYHNRSQPVFAVTHPVYETEMRRVTNNFDPHLDGEILDGILNDNYATVFWVLTGNTPDEPPAEDDLFREVVNDMIQTRTERGMPRVAEWRALAVEFRDQIEASRRGQSVRSYYEQLEAEAEERRRGK